MIKTKQIQLPQQPETNAYPMPLIMYEEGSTVKITQIQGGKGLVKRMKEMGLGIGSNVKIIKNNRPGGLVLEVMDSKLCIGKGVAFKIRAEEII
jgi:ferrous iron transport protein A